MSKSIKLSKSDYKRKLEHQIYLAQEHPARFYDLSYCDLNQIPNSVCTFCKVLRKYMLNLSGNKISSFNLIDSSFNDLSLLGCLVLSGNNLDALPSNFCRLINLKKLYLNENKFVTFPSVVVMLRYLQVLHLQDNKIKKLPDKVGEFQELEELDITGNPLIDISPCITNVKLLTIFKVDTNKLKNLPAGAAELSKCISTKVTKPPPHLPPNLVLDKSRCTEEYNKMNNQLEDEIFYHDLHLSKSDRLTHENQIIYIKNKSAEEERQIKNILARKYDGDRSYESIQDSFQSLSSHQLIDQLDKINKEAGKINGLKSRVLSEVGRSGIDGYCLTNPNLRVEIFESMKTILDKELQAKKYSNILTIDPFNVASLRTDEFLQKKAYHLLELESNIQLSRLQESMKVVQMKLVQLTADEINSDQSNNGDEAASRSQLVGMLYSLQAEIDQISLQIYSHLSCLENHRVTLPLIEQSDFWLVHFNNMSNNNIRNRRELQELLEPGQLTKWVYIFDKYEISLEMCLQLQDKDLIKMGIEKETDRRELLNYLRDWKFDAFKWNPSTTNEVSAPPINSVAPITNMGPSSDKILDLSISCPPTAPLLPQESSVAITTAHQEVECCICLADGASANTLHLPCGHVCCCKNCSISVVLCPLCRQSIAHRVILQFHN